MCSLSVSLSPTLDPSKLLITLHEYSVTVDANVARFPLLMKGLLVDGESPYHYCSCHNIMIV